MKGIFVFILMFILSSCSNSSIGKINNQSIENPKQASSSQKSGMNLIDSEGITIKERFKPPEGFERIEAKENSFGDYLRKLPLKPEGSEVMYYNGTVKTRRVHEGVIDMDVGKRDLQQCADAAMRLRAEYLYSLGQYDKIHFNFTNGFRADFSKWIKGYSIKVEGNNVSWVSSSTSNKSYTSFRKYLDMVFTYAGTLSLSKELKKVTLENMNIGDLFIIGGSPGHCVIVVDMAENKKTGEKLFMLAQSYMPAQDIHILKNPNTPDISPWYSLNLGDTLITPDWSFTRENLLSFE